MLDVDEVVSPSAAAAATAARRRRDRVRPVEALLPPRRRSCRSRGSLGVNSIDILNFLAQNWATNWTTFWAKFSTGADS